MNIPVAVLLSNRQTFHNKKKHSFCQRQRQRHCVLLLYIVNYSLRHPLHVNRIYSKPCLTVWEYSPRLYMPDTRLDIGCKFDLYTKALKVC